MPNRKQPKKEVSPSERALFRQAVNHPWVPPTEDNATGLKKEPLSNESRFAARPSSEKPSAQGIIRADGEVFYRPGIQKNTVKTLRRGRFKVRAEIDLHGCTQKEALSYLNTFLEKCTIEKFNCVLIITGKGKGSPNRCSIIREAAIMSLRQKPQVLAYSTALQSDGGTGALYVLLS